MYVNRLTNLLQQLAKSQEVQNEQYLNSSIVLAMTELLEQSVVNRQMAHTYYPRNAYGRMATKGMEMIEKQVIPYLQNQLERAVEKQDSHKIQVYIRALGNLGHPKILAVFEPYLEGKKQITEFERLAMVIALDKLAVDYPKDALTVLFKIYQNVAEFHQVRCAAVMQLMRTNPPAAVLQRMAEFANVDSSRQVRAVVKSVILSAAKLENYENQEL
ncbi:MAG: hypothetical protein PV362_04375 [Providencia heimbachae]|nr:hypothetical protein [Providencia heimbachae]